MARVRLYTTRWCGYCVRAKALLEQRGIPYEENSLDDDPAFRQTIYDLTGRWTVPQIFIDDEPIGGYVELWRLDQSTGLDKLAALRIVTGVPIRIRRSRRRIEGFGRRTQPCETRPGRISGWFVPWIPMKPPPGQSVSTDERPFVPKAIAP